MAVPSHMKALFRDLPLLSDEKGADYLELVDDIAGRLAPNDRWQWRCVRQLADKYWELHRIQQYPHHLIQEGRRAALREILDRRDISEVGWNATARVAEFFRDAKGRKEIHADLARHGLNDKSISARAFEVKSSVLTDCHRVMFMIQAEIAVLMQSYEDYADTKKLRQIAPKIIEGTDEPKALRAPQAAGGAAK